MPHFEISADDMMGQLSDTFGNLIDGSKPQSLKRPKHEQDGGSRDTSDQHPNLIQMLASLDLRHESQLQAIAIQDTFILFLQPGQSSLIPLIQQSTRQWKPDVEKKQATMSLRLKLITMITQSLLGRMLKVAQAQPTMEIWREALKHQLITESLESKGAATSSDEQAGHHDDEHAEPTRGIGRADQRPNGSGQAQIPQGQRSRLNPVESPSMDAPKSVFGTADALDVRSMEPPSRKAPATHGEGEPTGSQFGESILWPIEKETIMGWLMTVRLSNTGNDCYQNSALLAMFWALLRLRCPTWNDLGKELKSL